MLTYYLTAAGISDRIDCPPEHVRCAIPVSQDALPEGITQAKLRINEDWTIGPYPARIGAYWSAPSAGRAGYYVIVGPVPEADLSPELAAICRDMDLARELGET